MFFNMETPPPHAEFLLREAIYKQQDALGRMSRSRKPQTLVQEMEELDPSVKRVLMYLYDNAELTIDRSGVQAVGSPNKVQLMLDLDWLIDQRLAGATIHKGKQKAFITPRGEDLIDGGSYEDEDGG